jgi:outer membrane protein
MRAIETLSAALAAVVLMLGAVGAEGQPLPKVDGPLTLEQAVDLALQKNLRVRAAGADARVMESMRREALAPFWPQLSANGYVADQRMAPNVYTSAGNTMARNYQVFNSDQTRDGNLTAMFSLFAGGRDYYGYKAATRRAEAGREMLRSAEVEAAMQARLDYVAALREAENLRVTADLLREIEERLRVTREAFEAGRVPRFYLLRDETERANVLQMQAMAQSRADQALINLKTTLGVDLASAITLAGRLEFVPARVSIEEGIREASARQPEIRAAAKQREAAEAEVRAAYGNYFPQVSLSYMYDWAWSRNRAWESQADAVRTRGDNAEGYSVGVVVTLPLFDGLMRENALNTAKARQERAAHAEALVRQQIERDVNQAALMLTAAERGVEASRKGLEQAEECRQGAVRERPRDSARDPGRAGRGDARPVQRRRRARGVPRRPGHVAQGDRPGPVIRKPSTTGGSDATGDSAGRSGDAEPRAGCRRRVGRGQGDDHARREQAGDGGGEGRGGGALHQRLRDDRPRVVRRQRGHQVLRGQGRLEREVREARDVRIHGPHVGRQGPLAHGPRGGTVA